MVEQRSLALIIAIVATTLYLYYTVWMLFTPLIDADHTLQNYFPDRLFGIMGPTLLGYLLISIIVSSTGLILLNDTKRKVDSH